MFASAAAQKPTGAAATLLGLVQTFETLTPPIGPPATFTGETLDTLSNDSVPVSTTFTP